MNIPLNCLIFRLIETNNREKDRMNITVCRDYLEINGKPVFIYGGDLSYCRVPRRCWKERMLQMKAAGLNTVTVYAVWAYHQR